MSERKVPLKVVLGWISGTVALISLVLGVVALNSAVSDWRETRASVGQLIAGADAALAVGDYRLAKTGYDEAIALDASSPRLREARTRLALAWLRAMLGDLHEGEMFRTLTASLQPSLYEGLEGKRAREQSVIWAHIGWAHHLAELDLPRPALSVRAVERIRTIYDRAEKLDADNFYTPLFRGFLELDGGGDVDVAEGEFARAMALAARRHGTDSAEYRWAREMTLLASLNRMAVRAVGQIVGDERGLLLIRTIDAMRDAGEALPNRRFIEEALGFYVSHADINHDFEMIMTALPPDAHRLTYEWIIASETAGRWLEIESNEPALLSFRAALVEESDPDLALSLYREVYEFDWVYDDLAVRIEEGIARLSGEPPPRMVERLGRHYVNDAVPAEGDVHAFHLDSLMNFDVRFEPANSESAFEYFLSLTPDGTVSQAQLLADVTAVRDRMLDEYRAFKRKIAEYGYTGMDSVSSEIRVTRNTLRAHRLVALSLLRDGLYDRALAELDDAFSICGDWVPSWIYELRARTLSRRNGAADLELAADNLERFIAAELRYGGALDWSDVKIQPDFSALRATPRYQALMRGR